MSIDDDQAGADLRLEALFALDAPPAHDPEFMIAVARRTARRRLGVDLAWAALAAGVSALMLRALGPALAPAMKPFLALALAAGPAALMAAVVLALTHPRGAPI